MPERKKGGAWAPPLRTLLTYALLIIYALCRCAWHSCLAPLALGARLAPLALGARGDRVGSAAILRNLMRRSGEATGPAAGLRIAAARRAGHAGSAATVARHCSLPSCGAGVVVAPRHLVLRRSDSARHQQRYGGQYGWVFSHEFLHLPFVRPPDQRRDGAGVPGNSSRACQVPRCTAIVPVPAVLRGLPARIPARSDGKIRSEVRDVAHVYGDDATLRRDATGRSAGPCRE